MFRLVAADGPMLSASPPLARCKEGTGKKRSRPVRGGGKARAWSLRRVLSEQESADEAFRGGREFRRVRDGLFGSLSVHASGGERFGMAVRVLLRSVPDRLERGRVSGSTSGAEPLEAALRAGRCKAFREEAHVSRLPQGRPLLLPLQKRQARFF